MVHNLYVSSFLWILEQILSKDEFLKIPHFFKKDYSKEYRELKTENASNFVPKLDN